MSNKLEETLSIVDGVTANAKTREALKEEILDGEESLDALTHEDFRKKDEKDIHDLLIAAQAAIAHFNNKVVAYEREYDDLDSRCRIFKWVGSVQSTLDKAVRTAKANIFDTLPSGVTDLDHIVDDFIYQIKIAGGGGTALDVKAFKEDDGLAYEHVAKLYPRTIPDRKSIKMVPRVKKKGVK